jgi:SOUL heme-binding protein
MSSFGEIIVTVLAGFGQLVGIRSGTEAPKYEVVDRLGAVEIRQYGPRIAAEAVVTGPVETARSAGFRKVAGYIFGGNTTKASIAMTAPVAQAKTSQSIAMTAPVVQTTDGTGAWRIQFIMPAKYTHATLPIPNDPDVRIVDVPAQNYAVLRYSGSTGAKGVEQKTAELKAALKGRTWEASGEPLSWFYDPPWTMPAMRRNEVAIPVLKR